jgi:UDP-N-acetylmuramoylalanine--D-glutamate ligase
MIPVTLFPGRKVAVFGLGLSGLATAKALQAGGAEPALWDDGEKGRDAAREAGFTPVDIAEPDWSEFAALVLAPGVPLTHPKPHWTVERAKAAGVEVIGDTELFCRQRRAQNSKAKVLAITGTNGKSTTTALAAHLVAASGRRAAMGGNIGTAVLALDPPADGGICGGMERADIQSVCSMSHEALP